MWTRNGSLRSTVVVSDEAIYCVKWSPMSDKCIYTEGSYINMIDVEIQKAKNNKLKWKAHKCK